MALSTSRMLVLRGRPPRLAGGINGSISSHWASVRSVGYGWRSIPQLYRLCHFSDRLSNPSQRVAENRFKRPDGSYLFAVSWYEGPDDGWYPSLDFFTYQNGRLVDVTRSTLPRRFSD